MKKNPLVTINLLTWNGSKYLPWLLKSIQEQTFNDYELLILDNGSADDSIALVKEYAPNARIITKKKNLGFAKGHNLLLNWSKSKYVLVLNQDIILEKDYLETLVNFLENHKQVASVSGKLMYWDFENGVKTKVIDSFGLRVDRKRHVVDNYQGQNDFKLDSQEVFGLSGSAVLYRRNALDTISIKQDHNNYEYFDEDFFAYKEDIDIAWRLRLVGYQHYLITDTKAFHHRTMSSSSNIKDKRKNNLVANRFSYRNHLMILYKNSFCKNIFKDFFQLFWYEFKKFIYLLIFERSTVRGLIEFLQKLPKLRKKRKEIKKIVRVKTEDIYNWFK